MGSLGRLETVGLTCRHEVDYAKSMEITSFNQQGTNMQVIKLFDALTGVEEAEYQTLAALYRDLPKHV